MITRERPVMGLLLGEASGIGPELVAKSLSSPEIRDLARWVIIGDERVCRQGQDIANVTFPYRKIDELSALPPGEDGIFLLDLNNLSPDSYTLGQLSVVSGKATGETLKYALDLAQQGGLDGIVYAPLNKEALKRGGYPFQDEIHLFASWLGQREGFGEINVCDDLWFVRVTSHIPLKEVCAQVTKENVKRTIRFAADTMRAAGLNEFRIAVAAVNPHGGEGGTLGTEEIDAIIPAVEEARQEGIPVDGPFPADTVFHKLADRSYQCLVGMYHDQLQIGMKLMGFHRGVTISGGLPIVLTTPAHGTAFDIAGQGKANPGAMNQAIQIGVQMAAHRKKQIINKKRMQ